MIRRYFGALVQMSLPYSHQMQHLQPQPQTAIQMPVVAPMPAPQAMALPAPAYACSSNNCTEVVPYKPGYKYCLPPGT